MVGAALGAGGAALPPAGQNGRVRESGAAHTPRATGPGTGVPQEEKRARGTGQTCQGYTLESLIEQKHTSDIKKTIKCLTE